MVRLKAEQWRRSIRRLPQIIFLSLSLIGMVSANAATNKPMLHGKHWMAITGKPLAATSGARIFNAGGNAVDAACAMLATTSTMFDVLSWGGETQALIYHPEEKRVIAINALGAAPSGATPEYFKGLGMAQPPEYGPLAAVTPGTPGGLLVMLARYGTMSLKEVLAPAMEMAQGYPMEAQTANSIERMKEEIRKWPSSRALFLVHEGEEREAPHAGELFRQADLHRTLSKLVEAEQQALAAGADRAVAIMKAYERFYTGDIAEDFVRGSQALGGLHTLQDLADWQVYIEEPVVSTYKDIEVYKLNTWVQGPVMLQALNIAETLDWPSMGFNSANYIHTLYQVMNLAFADRDFYYGDPYVPPVEPLAGLLSKKYAASRRSEIDVENNDPNIKPGDPYLFQKGKNPYLEYLEQWTNTPRTDSGVMPPWQQAGINPQQHERGFLAGTTTIQAADAQGWVVSVTPSGGWIPAAIAGDTGIGMSQRMQSFVLDPAQNPYNVVQPGQRPRATLTPGMALKNGKPYLSFAVQGGDIQDQVLLQFFLGVVEFGMNVQEAVEAPYFWSYQMRNSFADHRAEPGKILLNEQTPSWVRKNLEQRGYAPIYRGKTSGPINAIVFDQEQGTFTGGASDFGEDYGIAW
ncbi:MAG: gamma-glutamyltransferase [Pseudomonadaceae bacterium]|nr:gamma-glutamyltransferase [Pseudomonadaceae bacterium]